MHRDALVLMPEGRGDETESTPPARPLGEFLRIEAGEVNVTVRTLVRIPLVLGTTFIASLATSTPRRH